MEDEIEMLNRLAPGHALGVEYSTENDTPSGSEFAPSGPPSPRGEPRINESEAGCPNLRSPRNPQRLLPGDEIEYASGMQLAPKGVLHPPGSKNVQDWNDLIPSTYENSRGGSRQRHQPVYYLGGYRFEFRHDRPPDEKALQGYVFRRVILDGDAPYPHPVDKPHLYMLNALATVVNSLGFPQALVDEIGLQVKSSFTAPGYKNTKCIADHGIVVAWRCELPWWAAYLLATWFGPATFRNSRMHTKTIQDRYGWSFEFHTMPSFHMIVWDILNIIWKKNTDIAPLNIHPPFKPQHVLPLSTPRGTEDDVGWGQNAKAAVEYYQDYITKLSSELQKQDIDLEECLKTEFRFALGVDTRGRELTREENIEEFLPNDMDPFGETAPAANWNDRIQRLARGRIRTCPQFENPGSLFYFAIRGDNEHGLNIEKTASRLATLAGGMDYLDTERDQHERQVKKLEKEIEILRNDKAILRKKLDESRRREKCNENDYSKSTAEFNSLCTKIGRLITEAQGSVEQAKRSTKASAQPFESEAPTRKAFNAKKVFTGRNSGHKAPAHDSDDEDIYEEGDLGDLLPIWRPSARASKNPYRSHTNESRGSIPNHIQEIASHVASRGASQRTPRPLSDTEGDSSAPQRKRFRKDK
ncbi:uncharacterized protein F5Z01DRAFT_636504 [Emericellopsis atlantica]|uniref:Uncharacterized protein n=1 Tax=Emericellopsis atlantica TaxID=2614577 RepID=A0A9P8CP38_9HYPO|nr:uncharacterized protein F5Z01DRAFT_636504 [Emericellopsis atlantica]KAG9254429.1 hypothetical protein F5Z01DRAFT_636504 [Emericellopsis atlantica]